LEIELLGYPALSLRHLSISSFNVITASRIVLEGLRGEDSIAELCRREGIAQNLYYRWVERLSGGWQEAPGR
jgi:hypothetical protein